MATGKEQHLEAIHDIRNMMKKSTRFLSLSGLSGVFAGIFALIGAGAVYYYLWYIYNGTDTALIESLIVNGYRNFILIAGAVLFLSVLTAYYFSSKKAKRQGHNLFDHAALRALVNLCLPLAAGGIFCLSLLLHGMIIYIAPVMLLFYGMALINASKYTYEDIRYLGICELILGSINAFNLGNGLLYWTIGFGLLHIGYGLVMWVKYEKK